MTTTTLAEIRSHGPCEDGFAKIRGHLGVSPADAKTHSEPFPVALLLETNGLDDALWVTAHVAPDALTRFLIRRLDDGDHSALKILRALDMDYSQKIAAVEAVVYSLRRKLAGEDVYEELITAKAAARDARAAYAARAAAYGTELVASTARATAYAAAYTTVAYTAAATARPRPSRAAAVADLIAALRAE